MEKKGEWHLVKKNYYQKQIKTIYRSKRNQPQFVKTGVKGATTLLGSASMLLSSAPVVLGAEEAGGTEGTEAVIEQTQLTNQTKETVETTPIEQPTIPEDLTESTDSVTPTEPTESVDPIEPEEPVKPIEPTDPVEPTEPTEQVKPTEPTKPVEPTEPKAPVAPINPSTDEQSKEVTAPVQTEPVPVEQPIVSQVETQPITELVPATTEASDGALHFEKDESVESFIKKIGEPARKIGQKEDLYASVMIAQAILESASGTSQLAQAPNYNLFGIKGSHNGKSASFSTQEDTGNGSMITIQAEFRAYENYEESFEDYAKLMKEGLAIPSVGICLPVFKGLENDGLYYGAGTLSADQKMGEGNYGIASHRSDQADLLFTPLEQVSIGAKIYLTDLTNVYTYVAVWKEKIDPERVEVLDVDPDRSLVTLLTCGDIYATNRIVVQGELESITPIDQLTEEAVNAFDLPMKTY